MPAVVAVPASPEHDQVGQVADRPGDARRDRGDEHVPVLDVGQLVGDHPFELLLRHVLENARRHRDDGVLGVPPGGKGVGLLVRRHRDPGHRESGPLAKAVHHPVELGRLRFGDHACAVHPEHHAVGEEVHDEIERTAQNQREDEPLRAAEQLAGEQEEAHQSRHEDHRLHVVHRFSMSAIGASPPPGSTKRARPRPLRAPRVGRRSRSDAGSSPLPAGPCSPKRAVLTIRASAVRRMSYSPSTGTNLAVDGPSGTEDLCPDKGVRSRAPPGAPARPAGGRRTSAPAGVSNCPSGITRSAFARTMDISIPEPLRTGEPGLGTPGGLGDDRTEEMLKPGLEADRLRQPDGTPGGERAAACPAIHRMAGRTKSSNVTMVLTGLPGSPIHGVAPTKPNPTGAPGRIRSRQKRWRAPSPRARPSHNRGLPR